MMLPGSMLTVNVGAVAGQGLVDGVVHDLIDQVVQAGLEEVEPMYMPGRFRTASNPSRTWISEAPYSCSTAVVFLFSN